MDFFAPILDFLQIRDSQNASTIITTTTTTTAFPTSYSLVFEITISIFIVIFVVAFVTFLAVCIHCDQYDTSYNYDCEENQQLETAAKAGRDVPLMELPEENAAEEDRVEEQPYVVKRNHGFYGQPVAVEDSPGIEKAIDSILAKRKWQKRKQATVKSPADGEEAVAVVVEEEIAVPNEVATSKNLPTTDDTKAPALDKV